MKKLMIITSILLASSVGLLSQVSLDVRIGMSPASNPSNASVFINRDNPFEEFQFNQVHTKTQLFGGLALNVQVGSPFFLEGGVFYTKIQSEFMIDYTYARESGADVQLMKDTEHLVLFPVNIGVSIGKVDLTSGVTLRKTLSQTSEMTHIPGFASYAKNMKFGWQMGARYTINRAMVGMEYQGSFNRVCQDSYVNNHSLEIMNLPGQFVFSVQYRF